MAVRLPLVRLASIKPFVDCLIKQGSDIDEILAQSGWTRDMVEVSDMFVPAPSIYEFTELAAQKTGDPNIGVKAALAMNIKSWLLLSNSLKNSSSVAECLNKVVHNARMEATSVVYSLSSDGEKANLSVRRTFQVAQEPVQVNAFGATYLLLLLKMAVGSKFKAESVTVVTASPINIPEHILPRSCVVISDHAYSIRFPADWLFIGMDHPHFGSMSNIENTSLDNLLRVNQLSVLTLPRVKATIEYELENGKLTVERISKILGIKPHQLRAYMRSQGTTFANVLQEIRRAKSCASLHHTNHSVANIASSLGYTDVGNFSRSFKRWTGKPPLQYRKQVNK
ncbi:MAG: AraC family transcriptional regulator [Hyphomicrobiales bacterium]|nr:AraC family transcriptional regulator [Hyphomicrobiales bacterium]